MSCRDLLACAAGARMGRPLHTWKVVLRLAVAPALLSLAQMHMLYWRLGYTQREGGCRQGGQGKGRKGMDTAAVSMDDALMPS